MPDTLNGLLGGVLESPVFNTGVGLLAASGPSRERRNFGQRLAGATQFASEAQRSAAQNQLMRARLEDDARRRDAIGQLQGMSDDPMVGLLAQIDPGATVRGLLQPAAQGLDPLQQAQLAKIQLDVAQALADREADARDTQREETTRGLTLGSIGDNAKNIVDAGVALQDTRLPLGSFFRRGGVGEGAASFAQSVNSLLGNESPEANKILTNSAKFRKNIADLTANLAVNATNAGLTSSATGLNQAAERLPDENMPLPAVLDIAETRIKALFAEADLTGTDLPNRKDVESALSTISEVRSQLSSGSSIGVQNNKIVPQPPAKITPIAARGSEPSVAPVSRKTEPKVFNSSDPRFREFNGHRFFTFPRVADFERFAKKNPDQFPSGSFVVIGGVPKKIKGVQ